MIQHIRERFFDLSPYTDFVERQQAIGVYVLGALALVIGILDVIFLLVAVPSGDADIVNMQRYIIDGSSLLLGLLIIGLTRSGNHTIAGWIMLLSGLIVETMLLLSTPNAIWWFRVFPLTLVFIPAAGMIRGRTGTIVTTIYTLGLALFTGPGAPESRFNAYTSTIGMGFVTYALTAALPRIVTQLSQRQGSRRLERIETVSEISQRLTRLDVEALLSETVEIICDSFEDVYHAQVFLVEEGYAVLRASSGDIGRRLLERGHRLAVGSTSVIGRVTSTGEYVAVEDIELSSVHARNELLIDTRAELALPLIIEDNVIGALDVQSKFVDPFQSLDIEIFQTLANQIAVAIDHARLYQEAQRAIAENREMAERSQAGLREIERLNQRLMRRSWVEYLGAQQQTFALTLDLENQMAEPEAEWKGTLAQTAHSDQIIREGGEISVPVRVRGQVIGAMAFEIDESRNLTSEDLDLLREVSERLGGAIEDARLIDELQRANQRESLVSEISTQMQAATTIDKLLSTAAEGLGNATRSPRVAIRLNMQAGEKPGGNGSGGERS
jgi:GAF domain-containing protein